MEIKNTFTAWQFANKQFLSDETEEYEIIVNMDKLSEPAGDVLNLCYLYPLAYSLYIKGKISAEQKLKVNICYPNDFESSQADAQTHRIKIFLRVLQLKEYIELKVASKDLFPASNTHQESNDALPELSDTGRLFPLYEATADTDESQQAQESSYRLFRMSFPELQECSETMRFPFLKIVQAMYRFVEDSSKYKGTKEHIISAEKKEELREHLTSEVGIWSKEISVLALAIWLMLLRDLIETKQLFLFAPQSDSIVDENKLAKSRMDAITYGEAMYQLIENACLHSDGKRAWFGFRMHRIPTSSEKSHESHAHVLKRYSKCFPKEQKNGFADNVPCLFEFFVIDSAYQQVGMTGHFNETVFQGIKDSAYKILKNQNSAYVPPQNKLDPVASTPAWKKAEDVVFRGEPLLRPYITYIGDLFKLKPRTENKKYYIEDLSEHYGLRLLRKIVSVNKGYIQGFSPASSTETQFYYNGIKRPDTVTQSPSCVTIWSAVLPLEYSWEGLTQNIIEERKVEALDNPTGKPREHYIYLKVDTSQTLKAVLPGPHRTKFEDVEACRNSFAQSLRGRDLPRTVLILESGETLYELEILVKSLFFQLVDLLYEKKEIPLRIAVILPNLSRVHEFIRLFSILYYDDELSIMRSVQIALCAKSNSDVEPIYIGCLLAGEHLSTTHNIARMFTYHYPEHTFCSLPILSYLIPTSNSEVDSGISLFPFDLFLSQNMFSSGSFGKKGESWESNLFLDRTKRILCTNIQEPSYGCLISDVHVRLGSKIHLDRFYEAELLFHDTGNIARFAYMLVKDLLHGSNKLKQNESVLLLGYEKFSAPLMIQIEQWLKTTNTFTSVCTAIIHDFGERKKEVRFQRLFEPESQEITATTQVVSVVPVGTTLSTVYKLHNTAKREYPALNSNTFARNYCIVLIGNQTDGSNNDLSPVTQRYWKNIQYSEHLVTVQPECYDGESGSVRYLIRVNATWYSPEDCQKCEDASEPLPILDVKHSETLPAAIFLLKDPRQGKFHNLVNSPTENLTRLSALLNHVHYSHICSVNNHFQFYIDFQRLFADNAEAIEKYFDTINVDPNAFHVLVSPLQISNSSIADVVIRKVFSSCSRFLYFNIADAYREEVRTKFSHVTQDYLLLRRFNPHAKLHIHYVDNSIINGALIGRARILMKMLMKQSGLDDSGVILFDQIFLLVNRSSFDTINSYVQSPKKQLHAYIHLAVPSYNTESDFCPACRLVEKYKLLRKRSSSEMLDLEFARLIKKHTKRTEQEHREILTNDIMHSPAYFGWVRQWLHVNVTDQTILSLITLKAVDNKKQAEKDTAVANALKKKIKAYLEPLFNEKDNPNNEKYACQQRILQKLSDVSLSDVLKGCDENDHFIVSVVELVQRHLVGPRDYMRLYSMQTAYEAMELVTFASDDGAHTAYYKAILRLIDSKLVRINQKSEKELSFVYNAEWLISYVKVLSRAQLSNYYAYRRAIVSIISTIITLISAPKEQFFKRCNALKKDEPYWSKILAVLECALGYDLKETDKKDELYPLICYQLNITLFHRICDLQVRWIITPNNVRNYVNLYMNCLERIFPKGASDIQINFPTEQVAILRYMKALKTATMSSEDDMPCLELVNTSKELSQIASSASVQKDMLTVLARFIQVENSRMLYSGMCDLEKKILAKGFDTHLSDYRPSESFHEVMTKLNTAVMDSIRTCYGGTNQIYHESYLLYQNYLSNFCRFWHKTNNESPLAALVKEQVEHFDEQKIGQVSYLLQYFLRLRSLEAIQHGVNQINDIPYAYEELCRTICGLSGFDMCYIVFRGVGKLPEIISQSGYHVTYMESQDILTVVEIDKILVGFAENAEGCSSSCLFKKYNLQNEPRTGFYLPCILNYKNTEHRVLILELSIHDNRHSNDRFYIILQNKVKDFPEPNATDVLTIARNILFMRFTLLEILTRDYALLTSFRYDSTYIRPMKHKVLPAPSILHLSDLHVDQENVDTLIKMVKRKITEEFRQKHPIDLLIISGDIADGKNANAFIMEERYRCVERLLNQIVICLWQDKMGYLSHDWRRRVVITTGNHDYASMNQYNAQLDMRTLVSGTPVKEETGTMSKFSYFIHFLIRYLDPPINELLSHDLNEVRNYRYLNLKLLCLNCSSRATPYRTNKLGVDKDIVSDLTNCAVWTEKSGILSKETIPLEPTEPYRICVAHYSPKYNLSYFQDSYHTLPGWEWTTCPQKSPINDLEDFFRTVILEEHAYRAASSKAPTKPKELLKTEKEFLKEYNSMKNAIDALRKGESCPNNDAQPFYDQLKGKIPAAVSEATLEKEYPLLKYIKQFCRWIEATDQNEHDESIAQFLKESSEHILMGNIDSRYYASLIWEIHTQHPLALILAGHIHAYSEEKLTSPKEEPEKTNSKEGIPVLVSDKLNNPSSSNEPNGYIIEFSSSSPVYQHYRLSNNNP